MTRTKPRWTEQGTTTPSVDGEKEGESRRDVGGRGDIDFAATNQGGEGGGEPHFIAHGLGPGLQGEQKHSQNSRS